jgi:hypothetical protein
MMSALFVCNKIKMKILNGLKSSTQEFYGEEYILNNFQRSINIVLKRHYLLEKAS